MLTTKEFHHCTQCGGDTTHIVVLVRETTNEHRFKDFLKGFIKSVSVGSFEAAMDDFDRHSICEQCGKKTINDNLT